jgi:GDP-mannose 6-dehydrogenase
MLTGTNKDFIDARIPHLSRLLTPDIDTLLSSSDVIVVNTKEMEFSDRLNDLDDKIIIDLVRLGDSFLEKENYIGINWSNNNLTSAYTSAEDTVLA